MKKDLHPTSYRPVVFQDINNGTNFVTKSTVATDEEIEIDGKKYPLVKVHVSSASHPFYTGQEKLVDVEGRVDKFKARTEAAQKKQEAMKNAAQKQDKRKKTKIDEEDS